MMMLGMLSCDVRSAAVRAALVIPGVLAMCSKVGAMRLGDCSGSLSTRWHSAHCARAVLRPWSGFPTSCACKLLPTVSVKPASKRLTTDLRWYEDVRMFVLTTPPLVCRRAISRWQYTLRCHRPPLGLAAGRAFLDAGSTESRPNVSHRSLAILQSSQRAAHLRWLAAAPAKPHDTRRTIVWRARDRVQDLHNGPVSLKRVAQR